MRPRNELSFTKQYQPLPKDFCDLAEVTFKETFGESMGPKSLKITGRIYPQEIIVRLSIGGSSDLKKHNFSVSVNHDMESSTAFDQMHLGLDILASFLDDFLLAQKQDEVI